MSKIIRMEAENVKRLRAVEITPDGSLVVIGGRNAQGKTSVLDAIEYTLGGSPNINKPIRDGERSARTVVETDEYVITRTYTEKGSKLKVESKNGGVMNSPQTLLDDFIGKLSFDPLAFSRMDAKRQVETLRDILGVDFTDLDNERKNAYDERTFVNREIKSLQAQADALDVDIPENIKEVSISELSQKLQEISRLENEKSAAENAIETTKRDICKVERQIDLLQKELEAGSKRLSDLDNDLSNINLLLENTDHSKEEMQEKINKAEETNRKVQEQKNKAELLNRINGAEKESSRLTERIQAIDEEKQKVISSAKFPIEGLSFDQDQILFDDIPFNQCSGAEQLKISLAMGLALNPKLKVILIRDGSLLDENNLKIVSEMAEKSDAQVWIERVGEGEEVSVIIEDGAIKA